MSLTVDQMAANVQSWMANLTITQHSKTPVQASPLFPYFNNQIKETIHNEWEEQTVRAILAMDYTGLLGLKDEINTNNALDRNYRQSRECIIKCKSVIYRAFQLRKAAGYGEKISLGDAVGSWMAGWLLADEYWKRQGFTA